MTVVRAAKFAPLVTILIVTALAVLVGSAQHRIVIRLAETETIAFRTVTLKICTFGGAVLVVTTPLIRVTVLEVFDNTWCPPRITATLVRVGVSVRVRVCVGLCDGSRRAGDIEFRLYLFCYHGHKIIHVRPREGGHIHG